MTSPRKLLILLVFACPACFSAPSEKWHRIEPGILLGVSGMALIVADSDKTSFLIVHDTKGRKVYTARVVIEKNDKLTYEALDWEGFEKEPKDLEGITRVPGDNTFIALASKGRYYRIAIKRKEGKDRNEGWDFIDVLKEDDLPTPDDEKKARKLNFEGISLQVLGNDILAVWGHRGTHREKDPGVIYWGLFDRETSKIGWVGKEIMKEGFPWPYACREHMDTCEIRTISDLKID